MNSCVQVFVQTRVIVWVAIVRSLEARAEQKAQEGAICPLLSFLTA